MHTADGEESLDTKHLPLAQLRDQGGLGDSIIKVADSEGQSQSSLGTSFSTGMKTHDTHATSRKSEWKIPVRPILQSYQPSRVLKQTKKKKLREFYSEQNEHIRNMHSVNKQNYKDSGSEDEDDGLISDEEGDTQTKQEQEKNATFAIRLSFGIQIFICMALVGCAVFTRSLSVVTSAMDSGLDLLSGAVLYFTNKAATRNKDEFYTYPVGKKRMEPLGVIIFSCLMGTAALAIIKEAIFQIVNVCLDIYRDHKQAPTFAFTDSVFLVSVGALAGTFAIKICLWMYCKRGKHFNDSVTVDAYATDHRNDCITNMSLCLSVTLSRWAWWIDPTAAILVSLVILKSWTETCWENMVMLLGKSAPAQFIQQITYLACNHHPEIQHIDTVRAFHFGENYIVEVDIVLSADMPLRDAHDIGESLQQKIEKLDGVERAFVHLDYEYTHKPEHTVE